MNSSTFVTNVIQSGQNINQHDYYRERALLSFSETAPGSLDLILAVWSQSAGQQLYVKEAEPHTSEESDQLEAQKCSLMRIYGSQDLRDALQVAKNRAKFFFIRQRNSRSRLNVSQELFGALCEECSIFDKIRDYVLCFGVRSSDIHVNPPALHYSILFTADQADVSRRISRFECAYVLRFVEPNNRTDGITWSIRQSGVYQQLEEGSSTPTWLFIAMSASLESQLNHYLSSIADCDVFNPWDLHFVLFDTAISGWRGCILFFAGVIQKQSDIVFMAQFEADEFALPRLEERQYIKKIEDNILDIIAALSFMLESLDSITAMYQNVTRHHSASADNPSLKPKFMDSSQHDLVQQGFLQRRKELKLYLDQSEILHRKVQSVSNLVSNILDLSNGNALRLLAIETRRENANMTILTQKSAQDAATVKVLTIITLIYLPLTVVTNFFSTAFVGTSAEAEIDSRVTVTSDVWILFAVGVPLTIITVYIWWIFAQKETKGNFPGVWNYADTKVRAIVRRHVRSGQGKTDATIEPQSGTGL